MIHIYCGDGKGKTTAATGLAVRYAGTGGRVLFARFLKNEQSGELKILDCVSEIDVIHLSASYGFYFQLSEKEKEEVKNLYFGLWEEVESRISQAKEAGNPYGMVVLDELMAAYQYELVPKEKVVRFLQKQKEHLEIVMTGRDPAAELQETADYISEIKKIRHPYDKGMYARKGIEY